MQNLEGKIIRNWTVLKLKLWTHVHPYGQRAKDLYEFCLKYIEKYKDLYNLGKLT